MGMDKVKLTNGDIWRLGNRRVLDQLLSQSISVIGIQTSMKLRRIVRTIQPQLEDLNAISARLVEQHIATDEDGNPVPERVDPKGHAAANEEWKPLMAEVFDVEVETIRASELQNLKDVPGQILVDLGDLLVDDMADEDGNTTKPAAAAKRQSRRKAG